MDNTSVTGVVGSTGGEDNNSDSKNAYAKAGLSTYKVTGINTDTGLGAGNISGTEDVSGISSADNNADGTNAYIKANFSIYNVVGTNAGAYTGDAIVTIEKVGSNINNIGIS